MSNILYLWKNYHVTTEKGEGAPDVLYKWKKITDLERLILPAPYQLIQCIVAACFPALSTFILKTVLKKLFVFHFAPCHIWKPAKQYATKESPVWRLDNLADMSALASNFSCEALGKSLNMLVLPALHMWSETAEPSGMHSMSTKCFKGSRRGPHTLVLPSGGSAKHYSLDFFDQGNPRWHPPLLSLYFPSALSSCCWLVCSLSVVCILSVPMACVFQSTSIALYLLNNPENIAWRKGILYRNL